MRISQHSLPRVIDPGQNFYYLACIQSVPIGVMGAMLMKRLAALYGIGTAIGSIFIGNLILWLIGLSIISMVYQEHTNAIENIKGYLGKWGGMLFSAVLVLSFLSWYPFQINMGMTALSSLLQSTSFWQKGSDIRIGAVFGILTSLLAVGGIRLIRWFSAISFPFIVCYTIYTISRSTYSISSVQGHSISLPGVVSSVLMLLPGLINLPTFFRHSRSKADSYLALTIMTICITFFECVWIWADVSSEGAFLMNPSSTSGLLPFLSLTVFFVAITLIANNLVNIYLASACYEAFIPRFEGTKGYAIMGLLGTAAYTFIQISGPVEFLVDLLNDYIAALGIVLLIGVLARLIIRHRPRKFEKVINTIAWLVGCIVATVVAIQTPREEAHSLLISMGASALFFLCVFFIEETLWALKKVRAES